MPVARRSGYDSERHGPRRVVGPGFHARVHAVVRTVPRGRVTTYGDVAAALGLRSAARHVGYALAAPASALPADSPAGAFSRDDVPWQRVVNARGLVSRRGDGAPSAEQCALLRAEGVDVDEDGRVRHFARLRFVPRGDRHSHATRDMGHDASPGGGPHGVPDDAPRTDPHLPEPRR